MKTGIELIEEERERQISKEGWTAEHDDKHEGREMAWGAVGYVRHYCERAWAYEEGRHESYADEEPPNDWYWDDEFWKPKNPISDLVRAGALIAAEIDRLQRIKE